MTSLESLINSLNYKYPIEQQTKDFLNIESSKILEYFNSVCILSDDCLKDFVKKFVVFKILYGTPEEQSLFKNFKSVRRYILRLYRKRPVVFYGHNDFTLDRNGEKSYKQIGRYSTNDYIGYDEIEISALLSISMKTPFVNDGGRDNKYTFGAKGSFEKEGYVVGQIGSRFEAENKMEWKRMLITKSQNTIENGYGPKPDDMSKYAIDVANKFLMNNLWASFYDVDYFYTFDNVVETLKEQRSRKGSKGPKDPANKNRFIQLGSYYFDTLVYKNRTRYLAKIFLDEANRIAESENKSAFCYVVGLGLGVWKFCDEQIEITLNVYIELLKDHDYEWISDVYFGYFPGTKKPSNNKSIRGTKIHYGTRNPSESLKTLKDYDPEDPVKRILIRNWAFDGNSYIGNEYFLQNLNTSDDPAAACSSYIAYIGNPDINKCIKV